MIVADVAVAVGLPPNAAEADSVMTSLLKATIGAAGVMLIVTVRPETVARTSERVNVGPTRPPATISGNNPLAERPRVRPDKSSTAALTALFSACTAGLVKLVRVMAMAAPAV